MILGVTLEEAVERVGRRGLTKTRDIASALRKAGMGVPHRMVRLRKGVRFPERCLLKAVWLVGPGRRSHWILAWDGTLYDPLGHTAAWYAMNNGKTCRIVSYLPLG